MQQSSSQSLLGGGEVAGSELQCRMGPGGPGGGPGPGWGPGGPGFPGGGPGWGPGGPPVLGPGPGGFFFALGNGLCNMVSSCFYVLCCCCLLHDCFGGPGGPPSGPGGPRFF